jgi:hypothetical protein
MKDHIYFSPESLDKLRARYPAALVELHDVESVLLGTQLRAGQKRANVFDFESGVRLIVGREDNGTRTRPGMRHGIHISGSIQPGSPEHHRIGAIGRVSDLERIADEFRAACVRHLRMLGESRVPEFIGFLDQHGGRDIRRGIPHFFISTEDPATIRPDSDGGDLTL